MEETIREESSEYDVTLDKIRSTSENSETISLKILVLKNLGLVAYKSWFQDIVCLIERDSFIVKAASNFHAEQMEKNFRIIIERLLYKVSLDLKLKIVGRE